MHTKRGDGVTSIKRRRPDFQGDGVTNLAMASGRDANPIRTLGYYSKPSHEGYRNTIELPKGNNVVPLRYDTIRLVQNGCSFPRLRSEDLNCIHDDDDAYFISLDSRLEASLAKLAKVVVKSSLIHLRFDVKNKVNEVVFWVKKGSSAHVSAGSGSDGPIRHIHGYGYGVFKVLGGYGTSIVMDMAVLSINLSGPIRRIGKDEYGVLTLEVDMVFMMMHVLIDDYDDPLVWGEGVIDKMT
ncbi:hypothetical protein Tco_0635071 [Tanacetum coccineum]